MAFRVSEGFSNRAARILCSAKLLKGGGTSWPLQILSNSATCLSESCNARNGNFLFSSTQAKQDRNTIRSIRASKGLLTNIA